MNVFLCYFLLFLAMLLCNFLFNILWKITEVKMTQKATQNKIDLLYANIVKKALSLKEDFKKEDVKK